MAKPRLLIVSQSYAQAENQKKLAALAGHFELTCVTPLEVEYIGVRNRLADAPAPTTFRIIGLETLGTPLSTTKYIYRGLWEVLRDTPADVILVESEPWALVRWQTWLLKRIHQPHALFGEYSAENLERRGWKGLILKWVYRLAVASADFVISISELGAQIYRKNGLLENRLLIAPQLGLDEEFFRPADPGQRLDFRESYGCSREAFVIGFCGRFAAEKGVRDLVGAVDAMRQKTGAGRIELVFMGGGPLREELVESQKTRPWLKLNAPCTLSEVVPFMQMLDLLVLPSKPLYERGLVAWVEQLGHVLLEAMACGVPCVGSDSGEIPNVIGDARAVFEHGNVESLTEKLTHVFLDEDYRKELAAFQRGHVLKTFTNAALGQRWGQFIKRRLSTERRSVLWVDPHLEWRSPAMRHMLHAVPTLHGEGWDIRAWCFASDADERVETSRLWCPRWLARFDTVWFFFVANGRHLRFWLLHGRPPAALVHTTNANFLGADVVSIHFVDALWIGEQIKIGFDEAKDVLRWLFSLYRASVEWLQFRNSSTRFYLAVSASIGQAVRARCAPSAQVEVFPNSYDETRFNAQVRGLHRQAMRKTLGLGEAEVAFLFVSQGHYKRKGFWLAVQALAALRAEGRTHLRFIVVGGAAASLDVLKARLSKATPDWAQWIRFVGPQANVEFYYAAGDAFLFPSHCEAFCLAEIEAAVCGLPLLLTPHPGSEMILQEGVNGRLLSFEPGEMSRQIASFLDKGLPAFTPGAGRGLNRVQYAENLAAFYQRILPPA